MLNADLIFCILIWGVASFLIGCGTVGFIYSIVEGIKNGKK